MSDWTPCRDPGCYVARKYEAYIFGLAVLSVRKPEPLDLQIICPHRPLCATCSERFVHRVPDRSCADCVAADEPAHAGEDLH